MDNFYASGMRGFMSNITGRGGLVGFAVAAEAAAAATRGEGAASLVVVLGSSLSLVGLVFAFITYSLFSDVRTLSGTTLMNLLASLFMAQLLYVIGVGGVQDPGLCSALSLALQYARLSVLCWLAASAHHTSTTASRPSSEGTRSRRTLLSASFIRYSLFGWGAPILCLASASLARALAQDDWPRSSQRQPSHHLPDKLLNHEHLSSLGQKLDHHLHHHNGSTLLLGSSFLSSDLAAAEGECWFPDGVWYFGLGFLAPAAALLLADAVLLTRSFLMVRYPSTFQMINKATEKINARRRMQVCLLARVSLLVGGVTALGSAARISSFFGDRHTEHPHNAGPTGGRMSGSSIWLAFDVASALEGIFVAACVTCDCGALRMYMKSRRGKGRKRKSSGRRSGSKSREKGISLRCPERLSVATSLQVLMQEPSPDAV